jgi:acetyl-CoA carboxylase carboxyl transferase subunit beta
MGLFSRTKPKIKVESKKSDNFSGWIKCSGCQEMIHAHELVNHLHCCPKCGYHYRLTADQRIALLADENSFQEMFSYLKPVDPLNFEDSKKYTKRLQEAALKSKHDEAAIVGVCTINQTKTALGVLDFNFMGGSMGSVVGERISLLAEYAYENDLPLVIVSASGGARMQESILSLMQMAKTSAALTKLHQKRLPYISILTNPTTGGVTASFASLGDIIIAEPDALIAFAGPRVVEQTIRQKLPPKAQKSEFLLEKGMIDCIVQRKDLKDKLSFFINFLMNNQRETGKERMPEKLKDLLKLAEEKTAQDIL